MFDGLKDKLGRFKDDVEEEAEDGEADAAEEAAAEADPDTETVSSVPGATVVVPESVALWGGTDSSDPSTSTDAVRSTTSNSVSTRSSESSGTYGFASVIVNDAL